MFCRDVLGTRLDREQQNIIDSVQHYPRTAVASGTARGKDYVSACACLCFLFLTPTFDKEGRLIGNTKVAMTAPTGRQVEEIMMPEVSRLYKRLGVLPGRLLSDGIKTDYEEWFLTGFKSDDKNVEAWSGFHAVNTMFAVTEASGISETVFSAIEGNLQNNSRLLIVFNPNTTSGYAARAMVSERFKKFRLSSLDAENVKAKKVIFQGQVDYEWVSDKVSSWCQTISEQDKIEEEGDFLWEGKWYRPNDLFRVKVLGMFPKVGEDTLIPYEWIEAANKRWDEREHKELTKGRRKVGVDVAGMGRDSSVICERVEDVVFPFQVHQSGGRADHMHIVGIVANKANQYTDVYIDTIGEGAGCYSRLEELKASNVFSCKFSEGTGKLSDATGQRNFVNMRAYCYWAMRDWLDPRNNTNACLPRDERLIEEMIDIRWQYQSTGKIQIEAKEEIKKRLKRSPDRADALAMTFYPKSMKNVLSEEELLTSIL